MPLRQYFIWVGSVLLAALFAADWCLPVPAVRQHSEAAPGDAVNLRIRSDHRWPERIVFDTAHWPATVIPLELTAERTAAPRLEQRGPLDALASLDSTQAAAANEKASAIRAKPLTAHRRASNAVAQD